MDVGQTKIAAGVTKRKPFVVESQQVQHGGVQIMHVYTVLDCSKTEFVRCSVDRSAFDAAPASHIVNP